MIFIGRIYMLDTCDIPGDLVFILTAPYIASALYGIRLHYPVKIKGTNKYGNVKIQKN